MLEVKGVTKQFGGIVANHNVSFSIEQGQIVGLIGPNGAGKSTMFNMISCVFPPSEGEILFESKRIDHLSSYQAAQLGISRTFQNLQVFRNMSVLENVMVGQHIQSKSGILSAALRLSSMRKEETAMITKAMEMLEFVGLNDLFETNAGNLPLGKLRLLELARALETKPKLLLLDEIAAGLNHKETQEMGELISNICQSGVTVFIVEHDMDLVMSICDQVIVLDQGEKIAQGTPKEVQQHERVISAYLGVDVDEAG